MITLHHGRDARPFVVNADLVETVEATPDTVIALSSGRKLIVRETPDEVVALALEWRRRWARPQLLTGDASRAVAEES